MVDADGVVMAVIHAPERTADVEQREQASMFDQIVSTRTLNMVALATSVLWLLAMLSTMTRVAEADGDEAVWDYVAATNESAGFLVVAILAWIGAAVVGSLRD